MMTTKYDGGRNYDDALEFVLNSSMKAQKEKEDDFLLLCVGTTGSGKSNIMLHALEYCLKDEADVKYVGLNRSDFATALKSAKDKNFPRFCSNDEANVNKRDSLSKYNKHLMDLYMAIRGLRILHWWNNPSLAMIDKFFIEERIKGLIFIATKDKDKPRVYYYFTKKGLLQMWEKYCDNGKPLTLKLLKRVARKYAYYKGWFKPYKGFLLDAYLEKKVNRMDEKVDEFFNTYGEDKEFIDRREIANELKLGIESISNYEKELIERGLLMDSDIQLASTGKKVYRRETFQLFKDLRREKIENNLKNFTKNKPTSPVLEGFGGVVI